MTQQMSLACSGENCLHSFISKSMGVVSALPEGKVCIVSWVGAGRQVVSR